MRFLGTFVAIVFSLFSFSSSAGLIAHYNFDGNLNDSASSHVATGFGALSYVGGIDGQALNLDNGPTSSFFYVNEYVQLQSFNLGTDFSLSHWVRFDSNAHSGGHVAATMSLGSSGVSPFRTAVTNTGQVAASVSDGIGGGGGTGFVDINDGTFHHLATTISSNSISIFLDGVLQDTTAYASLNNIGIRDGFVGLHQWIDGGIKMSSRFDGAIDDLRLYDHTLSASEIQSLAQIQSSVPEPITLVLLSLGLFSLGFNGRKRI